MTTNTRRRPIQPTTARPRRTLRAGVSALCALIVLVVLLVGPPLLLVHFVRNPLSGFAHFSLMKPLTDLAVKDILVIVIWLAWAQLASCVLIELANGIRGIRRSGRVPRTTAPARVPLTLGFQQKLARQLVVAILAFLSIAPSLASVASSGSSPVRPIAVATAGLSATAFVAPHDDILAALATTPAVSSVVVRSGDDLEQLALTHLGSASRWVDIWELNEGSVQPGGVHFTDPSLIRPGWTLRLPTAEFDPQNFVDVTVQPHDTIWSLAQTHLGSGERWPEIWRANQGSLQSAGRRFTDPARIRPGWVLRIPALATEITPTAPATASTPVAPETISATRTALPTASPAPAPAADAQLSRSAASTPTETPLSSAPSARASGPSGNDRAAQGSPAAVPSTDAPTDSVGPMNATGIDSPASGAQQDSSQAAPMTQVGLGLSAFAAAAVVGAVGRRRILQHRHRGPGRRIAMPGEPSQAGELELRVTEDGAAVALLDRVARTLMLNCARSGQTFPPIAVIRLFNRGVELLLMVPAPAIEPFTAAGERVWRFDASTAGHLLATDEEIADGDVAFPFPLLVAIGVDDRGPVLVNLEAAGALTVIGEPRATLPVLHAAAAELVTSGLSEMATVQLIGVAAELAHSTEAGRATAHDDLTSGLIEPTRFHSDTVHQLEVSDSTTMHEARTRGEADLTWPSHAVVFAGPLDDDARQQIAASGVAAAGFGTGVITTAATAEDALPGWILRPAAQLRLELEPFGLTVQPQQLSEADLATISDLLSTGGDLTDVPPADPAWAGAATTIEAANRGAVTTMTVGDVEPDPDPATPMVRVLGPVTTTGARGEPPRERLAKATELAAYLALHPGANRDRVTEAIWPVKRITANYRQQVMSGLRGWLGTADDGEPYLGLYELHPDVRCDWTEFETRAKKGFAAGVAGLADLEAALALVSDRPFAGVRSGSYAWADSLMQNDIIPAIRDVADAVATIRLAAGDPARARAAAATGLLVEPMSEVLLRLALRAAHQRGDHHDLAELIARIDKIADELDDNDPETVELLATVRLVRT